MMEFWPLMSSPNVIIFVDFGFDRGRGFVPIRHLGLLPLTDRLVLTTLQALQCSMWCVWLHMNWLPNCYWLWFFIQNGNWSQTYSVSAVLINPKIIRCSLSPEQLNYNSFELNFTSIHEPGFDFNCLYPGSPVIDYAISISNDGQRFSSEESLRIFDSLCIDCDDSGCTTKVRWYSHLLFNETRAIEGELERMM
jgi:hypothetical protein